MMTQSVATPSMHLHCRHCCVNVLPCGYVVPVPSTVQPLLVGLGVGGGVYGVNPSPSQLARSKRLTKQRV